MKSYITLFLSILLFTSCFSDDSSDIIKQTEADIVKYIEDNNLNATKTSSGLYYTIDYEGSGKTPIESSIVDLKYKAYFLDGSVDGESESLAINLASLIEGLKEGIQLFKEGGKGTLIIPYELAFGEAGNASGSIPGGTVLIFDIEILAVYEDYESQNEAAILNYIEENNLQATRTDSGLYYIVDNEGTGIRPTTNSNVTVAYKGYFLDGTIFDESSSAGASFFLDQVISGWKEGIPYFKEGGNGTLLVPYTLGYGENGNSSIPGFSVLAFDVNLISVNN